MFHKFILIFLVLTLTLGNKLPPSVTRCSRNDSKCISNGIKEVLKLLTSTGFPQKGIEPANPLKFDDFCVDRNTGTGPSFEVFFKNVKVKGISSIVVKDVKIDFIKKCRYEAKIFAPHLEIYGNYRANGLISIFNYKGVGRFNMSISDVDIRVPGKCKFNNQTNNGQFMENLLMKIELKPKKVYLNFENIFDGNKEISTAINEIFNENSLLLFEEESVHHSKVFANKLIEISNKFLKDIPNEDLFLD